MEINTLTEVYFNSNDVIEFLKWKKILPEDNQEILKVRFLKSKRSFIAICGKDRKFQEINDFRLSPEDLEIVLSSPIEKLDVSKRTFFNLKRAGLKTFKDIYPLSEGEIRKFYHIGKISVEYISKSLKNFGVMWPQENLKEIGV
jgi:DNA-directed RNA polymerase alpha subunit